MTNKSAGNPLLTQALPDNYAVKCSNCTDFNVNTHFHNFSGSLRRCLILANEANELEGTLADGSCFPLSRHTKICFVFRFGLGSRACSQRSRPWNLAQLYKWLPWNQLILRGNGRHREHSPVSFAGSSVGPWPLLAGFLPPQVTLCVPGWLPLPYRDAVLYHYPLTLAIACLESPHVSSCLKVQTLLCDPLALREVTLQVYLPSSRTLLVLSI